MKRGRGGVESLERNGVEWNGVENGEVNRHGRSMAGRR